MKPNLSRLYEILQLRRPADSATEEHFAEKTLPGWLPNYTIDDHGNIHCQIGDNPTTLFTSHTDTVHTKDGTQKLVYDREKLHLFTQDADSSCLGADDGTGIWLMCHMIDNNVPGLYVFHREEEIGGRGSSALAKQPPTSFTLIERCISFDRKGYTDVITHQRGARTASDDFADALASHLPGFTKSDNGVFTDSKNYRHIIPECTNLSVGYFQQHTSNEYQDLKFAVMLATHLCNVPWNTLPTKRDPAYVEPRASDPFYDFWDSRESYYSGSKRRLPTKTELQEWVQKYPLAAAQILYERNITCDDMERASRLLDITNKLKNTTQ